VSLTALGIIQSWPSLPLALRGLAILLADHHHSSTNLCIPGIDAIARQSRCQRRTIQRMLVELEKEGVIKVMFRYDQTGRQLESSYTFLSPINEKNTEEGDKADTVAKAERVNNAVPRVGGGDKPSRCEEWLSINQIPLGIDPDAWRDYDEYRRTSKNKKVRDSWTPIAQRNAAKLLAPLTPEEQQTCVSMASNGGWQGLFPDRVINGQNRQRSKTEAVNDVHREVNETAFTRGLNGHDFRETETTLPDLLEKCRRRDTGGDH